MTAAGSRMVHRCQLQRDANAGIADSPNFQNLGAAVPCYLWTSAGREAESTGQVTVVEDLRALIPLGTDITVTDRIATVVDRLGQTVDAGPLTVEAVLRRNDHLELVLQGVSH